MSGILEGTSLSITEDDNRLKLIANEQGLAEWDTKNGYLTSDYATTNIQYQQDWLLDRKVRLEEEAVENGWSGAIPIPPETEAASLGMRVNQSPSKLFAGVQAAVYDVDAVPIGAATFASVPELVFVEGYADTEDMNIYILDEDNLWPAGAMPWDALAHPSGITPYKTPNSFTPSALPLLTGTLPTGVTWDKSTGVVSYDGSAISSNEVQPCNLVSTTTTSSTFNIKVLKVTETFDFLSDGVRLHDVVTNAYAGSPTGEIVILVKQGEWILSDHIGKADSPTFFKGFEDYDNVYMIGEPVSSKLQPILSGDRPTGFVDPWDGDPFGNQLTIILKRNNHVHFKNLRIRHGRFAETANNDKSYTCLNKIMIDTMGNASGDNFMSQKPALINSDMHLFVSNFETFWTGSGQVRHPFYIHNYNGPPWTTGTAAYEAYTHIANYKAWETHSPGQALGGHAFKDLSKNTELRHFYLSRYRDPTVSTANPLGFKLMSMHSHRKFTVTNGVLWDTESLGGSTTDASFLIQNRGISAEHFSSPQYYSLNEVLSTSGTVDPEMFPYWENANGLNTLGDTIVTSKNLTYHGPNAAFNYSATGLAGDLLPNPVDTPQPAAFWDSVGDVTDITNTNEFLKHKFVSHVTFNNVLTGASHVNAAVKFAWDAPENPDAKFGAQDNYALLPVPPNWKPLTHLFMYNNTYNDFADRVEQSQTLYNFRDASGPNGIEYAHAPTQIDGTGIRTDFGGNIADGVGTQIALPEGFKI